MLTAEFAARFADEWIAAWNAHDLPAILSHYADDFAMSTPIIVQLMGEPSGTLRGQAAVGEYWRQALARVPDLHFELLDVLVGVDSLCLYYRSVGGRLAAEHFEFGPDGLVVRAAAHYQAPRS